MTRVTNFGIKRTYVQAGFSNEEVKGEGADEKRTQKDEGVKSTGPPKKKQKRDRQPRDNKLASVDTEIGNENDGKKKTKKEAGDGAGQVGKSDKDEKPRAVAGFKKDNRTKKNELKKAQRKASSEHRRLKRIESKRADITCFMCREKGHTAKECQKLGRNEMGQQQGRSAVGICYRCGSRRHNLSRCKKPTDPLSPLPFASCFVCHRKGHLTSTCPENKEKGVYPNGGCCKLCGETSHLAKDCGLRKQDNAKTAMVLGTGTDAGADEDDFHTLNRKKRDVDQEEKQEEKKKRLVDNTDTSKVVYF